jgi:plasmid stabilization system protein ParE
MKLFWTEPAIQDLRDLRDYIAADSDFHAADFIASIITRAERLTTFPMIGRLRRKTRMSEKYSIGAIVSSTESWGSASMCSR